jgi:hypothetical protein
MAGVGHMLVFGIGALDLEVVLPGLFGDTQFKKVCSIAALAMVISQFVTCWAVEERILIADEYASIFRQRNQTPTNELPAAILQQQSRVWPRSSTKSTTALCTSLPASKQSASSNSGPGLAGSLFSSTVALGSVKYIFGTTLLWLQVTLCPKLDVWAVRH